MATKADTLQKSTPSLPPRPEEISLITSYSNPWAGNPRAEYSALNADKWSPHANTFRAVANVPNEVVRKVSGRKTGPDLIRIVDIASLGEMAKAITHLPGGGERPAGSLKRVNLFGHGNAGLIGLRGRIDPKTHDVYFGDPGPDRRPDVLMSDVDLSSSWAIDELAIAWLNSCGAGIAIRDRIRRTFCRTADCKAELWLIVCHGAGGRSGIDAGPGSILSNALASTLQMTVRAYSNSVWYWPTVDDKRARILGETTTSDGKTSDRGPGYYSAENITDPDTKKRLGEHMKNASTFEPDPKREPFKVTCHSIPRL
jgi:hypothetical protein